MVCKPSARSGDYESWEALQGQGLSTDFLPTTSCTDRNKGKRGVVLGSGPSLKRFDYSKLNQEDLVVVAINEEGHRNKDKYIPDYWMFSDLNFALRLLRNGYKPSKQTEYVVNDHVIESLGNESLALPKTSKPGIKYKTASLKRYEVARKKGEYFLNKTTATVAICHLINCGVTDIWLGGIDVCFKKNYYTDNDKRRGAPKLSSAVQVDDGVFVTQTNIQMICDLSNLAELIDDHVTITQGCMHSPLEVFPKDTFRQWYGRS